MTQRPVAELSALDLELFYARYWRRRPVLIRGGAGAFLDPAIGWDDVAAFEGGLTGAEPGVSRSSGGDVLFVNQAQRHWPVLHAAAEVVRTAFQWPACTADLSVTRGSGSGIGAHFDHSDNFVVQQQGTKHWLVGRPADTPETKQRLRMVDAPGFVPRAEFTSPPEEALLVAGDVLYLPLFAPHQGAEAEGSNGSVSVSFSCNAESALSTFGKALLATVSRSSAWWSALPLPSGSVDERALRWALDQALSEVLADQRGGQPDAGS